MRSAVVYLVCGLMAASAFAGPNKENRDDDSGADSLTQLAEKETVKGLPDAVRHELDDIVAQARAAHWLHPDGKPLTSWKVFYAKSISEAESKALRAMDKADTGRDRAETSLTNKARQQALQALDRAIERYSDRDRVATAYEEELTDYIRGQFQRAGHDATSKDRNSVSQIGNDYLRNDLHVIAKSLVAADLDFEGKAKHRAHLAARWQVWTKGYALAGDVNGTLYVFAAK